ncbi:hypothetical protein D9M71_368570 [compost metagenome]
MVPESQRFQQQFCADIRHCFFIGTTAVPIECFQQALGQVACFWSVEQAPKAGGGLAGQLLWCHRWCDFFGQGVDDGAGFICDDFADDVEHQDVIVLLYQFTDLQSLFKVQSVNGAFFLHLFNQSGQGV